MGPRTGMECDGVNNCKEVCLLADKNNITYEDCYDDEDPTRCSICPKDYGYPKREGRDIWSASYLCHKMGNVTQRCAIPCNGKEECPGKASECKL